MVDVMILAARFWIFCINQLRKLQNRASRIITIAALIPPSRPLIAELGWQTIEELIDNESKNNGLQVAQRFGSIIPV